MQSTDCPKVPTAATRTEFENIAVADPNHELHPAHMGSDGDMNPIEDDSGIVTLSNYVVLQ
jgi:hypothetical protein